MPIYEYECKACGEGFEEMRKRKDPSPVVCPHCDAEDQVERLISSPMLQFKGSGFYHTDYRWGKLARDAAGKQREKQALPEEKLPTRTLEDAKNDTSSGESSEDTSTSEASSSDTSGSDNES